MPTSNLTGESPPAADTGLKKRFTCRFCGRGHDAVVLAPRQKALCNQCGLGLTQGSRLGSDATLAMVITALILAVPAFVLPFVTVGKLGSERTGHLLSGARALQAEDMPLLSVWVALCAGIAPVLMLVALAVHSLPPHFGQTWRWTRGLKHAAVALEEWAMPEVYVLAVLVALTKLGSVVEVEIEPGFWCYVAMSIMLLIAWRNFHLGPASFSSPEPEQPASS